MTPLETKSAIKTTRCGEAKFVFINRFSFFWPNPYINRRHPESANEWNTGLTMVKSNRFQISDHWENCASPLRSLTIQSKKISYLTLGENLITLRAAVEGGP